jgi:ubiquinone/menaquinone biosynthesis C-methylase UbiE
VAAHRDTIIEQFTQQAPAYADAAPINDAALPALLVRASAAGRQDAVLDVACGPGIVTCAFAAAARSAVGLDLVEAMLERARSRAAALGLANVEFVAGDAGALPFADGTFDIVVSRFALHHLERPGAAVAEMARVCSPGGRVVVCDVSPEPAKSAAFNEMELLRDPSHVRSMTEDELRGLFAAAGRLAEPSITRTAFALELEEQLARSFPASPGDAAAFRRIFEAALEDDRLGVGAHRNEGRIEYAFPVSVFVSRAAEGRRGERRGT